MVIPDSPKNFPGGLMKVSSRCHLLAVSLLLLGLLSLPQAPLSASTLRISSLEQPVKYRGRTELTWTELTPSDTRVAASGDFLVGDGGFLELRRAGTETIKLNEQTGLSIRNGQRGDTFRVNHGSSRFDLKPDESTGTDYTIRTKNASIGVRGTNFGVSYERDDRSEVFVDTGSVQLSDGDRPVRLGEGRFGRVSGDDGRSREEFEVSDTIPERHKLTWDHWNKKARIRKLRLRKQELNERRKELRRLLEQDTPRDAGRVEVRLETINERISSLESTLARLTDSYETIQSRYQSYRRKLAEKRENFIQRRRQALDQFRKQRMKELREMKQKQEQGIDEMRRRRQDFMENR
ncbi:MAG: FecR domain-containing protein [bacterium]